MKTQVVYTFSNLADAHLAKHILENENINCFLENETITTTLPGYSGMLNSGIKLRVEEINHQKSIELLAKSIKITCVNCGSEDIRLNEEKKTRNWFIFLFGLIFMSPIGQIKASWRCNNCNHKF